MTSLFRKQKARKLFRKAEIFQSATALSSLALLAPATLVTSLVLTQEASATCVTTDDNMVCTGSTYSVNSGIAYFARGNTSIVNEGDIAVERIGLPDDRLGPSGMWGRGDRITLTNNGTVRTIGKSSFGMEIRGNDGTITNHGVVNNETHNSFGLFVEGHRNVLLNTGTISGVDKALGLFAQGNNNRLINSGLISGNGPSFVGFYVHDTGNTLINTGTVSAKGDGATGMASWSGRNTLLNEGTIKVTGKDAAGISSFGQDTLVNRGTIEVSGEFSYGVETAFHSQMSVVNEAAGVIESANDSAIKFLDNEDDTVENYGRLSTGVAGGVAVDLGGGNDSFLIGSTSAIVGAIEAGTGSDTFVLAGKTDGSFDLTKNELRNFEIYEKIDSSTWTISGRNDASMPWAVKEGGLMVTGTMGNSAMDVHSGAMLGGTGTVGSINARSGSTLSPGVNGIGSLAVTGNVLIANGTIYKVDLNAMEQSDRIVADGKATVQGGTVQVNALPEEYKAGSRWTILTAKGGVTGQFSRVTTNLAFFKPTLNKDGQNIYLELERINRPLPGGRPAPRPFDPVDNDDLPDVLDQTSGAPVVSAAGTILAHDDLFRAAVLCRLRCSAGGVASLTTFDPVLADYTADLPTQSSAPVPVAVQPVRPNSDWVAWGKAVASWGSTDATATSRAMERNTAGLVFGIDSGFGTPYRLGIAGGYFSSNLDVASLASSGSVESLHIGAYGSASFGALNLRGGVAYAHHEVDMSRAMAFTGFSGSTRSESSVESVQVFGEIGYTFLLSSNVAIEPFLGLAHVHIGSRGVREEGSELSVAGQVHSLDTTYSTLGARLIASWPTSVGEVTFKGLVGWRHAFGDVLPKATFSYVDDGRPFLVTGAPIDKDSLVVEAGLNWAVAKDVTLSVSYTGAMGAKNQEHTVRGGLTVRF